MAKSFVAKISANKPQGNKPQGNKPHRDKLQGKKIRTFKSRAEQSAVAEALVTKRKASPESRSKAARASSSLAALKTNAAPRDNSAAHTAAAISVGGEKTELPSELFELDDLVGRFIEHWGFKRIHGRIWVHLYTSSRPLDSCELMERLKVSKGLMSLAMRDLLRYQVIREAGIAKYGTVLYEANPDVMKVISNVLRQRESTMLLETSSITRRLKREVEAKIGGGGCDLARLESLVGLVQSAQILLDLFLQDESKPEAAFPLSIGL